MKHWHTGRLILTIMARMLHNLLDSDTLRYFFSGLDKGPIIQFLILLGFVFMSQARKDSTY